MKVVMANLTNGGLSGGYRNYLQKLISLLYANNNITHIDIFVPPQTKNVVGLESYSLLSWPVKDHKKGFPWVKAKIKELAPDVVLVPTAQWIDCDKTPVVTMIRNMEPLTVPFGGNPWKEVVKNIGRAYIAKRACKKSTRVIAVSKHVKDFLHKRWGIELGKIATVYHGIETPNMLETMPVPSCLKNEEKGQFLFTAGSIRPARGLNDIIHVLGILHTKGLNQRLVIAGGVDPGMEKYKHKLEKMSDKLGIASQIIWAGSLSSPEMSWCYRNCSIFIMISRAEACPNIALEAMAHGCVCISTETSPMPEFFKDAAVYYPPKNGQALAEVIQTVLTWDNNQRKTMSEKARKRAGEFSWDVCAEKTVAAMAKAAGIKSNRMG